MICLNWILTISLPYFKGITVLYNFSSNELWSIIFVLSVTEIFSDLLVFRFWRHFGNIVFYLTLRYQNIFHINKSHWYTVYSILFEKSIFIFIWQISTIYVKKSLHLKQMYWYDSCQFDIDSKLLIRFNNRRYSSSTRLNLKSIVYNLVYNLGMKALRIRVSIL